MIMTEQEMYYAELASQCKGLVWHYSIGIGFAPTARENNFMRGQVKGYELAYKALKVGDTLTWLNKLIGEEAARFADQEPSPEHDKTDGLLDALRHVRDAIVDDEYLYNEEYTQHYVPEWHTDEGVRIVVARIYVGSKRTSAYVPMPQGHWPDGMPRGVYRKVQEMYKIDNNKPF